MSVQPKRWLLNISNYNRMIEAGILTDKDHVELINGNILEMSPVGSQHAAIVNRISNLLARLLGEKAIISVQNPIHASESSQPEPDIAVLKPSDTFYSSGHPKSKDILFLIEVADTSLLFDQTIKASLYANAEVPTYWIVNLETKEIEQYSHPEKEGYASVKIFQSGDKITLPFFNISIPIKDLLGE